jgi:hypothetical protein
VSSSNTPIQNRYYDQYQQLTNSGTSGTDGMSPISTVYPRKYLSRVSNQQFLKAIGNDLVLRQLHVAPSSVGLTAIMSLEPGVLIHDDTLISTTATCELDLEVGSYWEPGDPEKRDTPTAGYHLCVFSDFKFIESPDFDSQTQLTFTAYHVNATGDIVSGTPTFDLNRNLIMMCILDYTRTAYTITDIQISALTQLTVKGKTFVVRGGYPNMSLYPMFMEILDGSGTSGVSGQSVGSGSAGTSGTSGTSGSSGISGSSGTSGSS